MCKGSGYPRQVLLMTRFNSKYVSPALIIQKIKYVCQLSPLFLIPELILDLFQILWKYPRNQPYPIENTAVILILAGSHNLKAERSQRLPLTLEKKSKKEICLWEKTATNKHVPVVRSVETAIYFFYS